MKKLPKFSIFFFYLLLANITQGQDCNLFYYFQNGKTIEVSLYNKKGEPNGKRVSRVISVDKKGSDYTGTVVSENLDKKGKLINGDTVYCHCVNGIYSLDIRMLLPKEQKEQFKDAKATSDKVEIEYPSNMSVGDKLKDAYLSMALAMGAMNMNVTYELKERKVSGKETITSDAGTWEAYKIDQLLNVTTMGIPFKLEMSEWYVPNFGSVKSVTKYGSSLLTSYK